MEKVIQSLITNKQINKTMILFSRDEWQGIGKKDQLTYWDAGEYPES